MSKKRILIFCVCILLICFPAADLAVKIFAQQQSMQVYPVQSYFTSPSTSNGVRRFLAVGNFFDTTNDAYFYDSQATVIFDIPDNQNQIINNASVKFYKYANAYSGSVNIELYSQSGIKLASNSVDNGDMDFDLVSFNVSNYIQSHKGDRVSFILKVPNAAYHEGVALCSGNFFDSVCTNQYRPVLEIGYLNNTFGRVASFEYDANTQVNAAYQSDFTNCKINSGCQIGYKIRLQDEEANLTFKISFLKAGQLIKSVSTSQLNQLVNLQVSLPDGEYQVFYELVDLNFYRKVDLQGISIDTTPPAMPSVEYHSAYGTRSGVLFQLKHNADIVEYEANLCEGYDIEESHCINSLAATRSDNDSLHLMPTNPLVNKSYYYVISAVDCAGNLSQPLVKLIEQKNDLISLKTAAILPSKLSYANHDGKFDISRVDFKFTQQIKLQKVKLLNSKNKIIFEDKSPLISAESFMFDVSKYSKNQLPDGKYYLQLTGIDGFGYATADHKPIYFAVDNTAPRVYALK